MALGRWQRRVACVWVLGQRYCTGEVTMRLPGLPRAVAAVASLAAFGSPVAAMLLFGACGGAGDEDAGAARSAQASHPAAARQFTRAPLRACGTRGEVNRPIGEPDRQRDVIIGPASLSGGKRLAFGRYRPTRTRYLHVKIGFSLRAEVRAALVVPPAYRTRIGLQYARNLGTGLGLDGPHTVRNGGAAVRFHACASDEPAFAYRGTVGRWTWFPGGFAVSGPGCYPLELHVKGRDVSYRRTVGFGVSDCPEL
jgi:hypothetical protein